MKQESRSSVQGVCMLHTELLPHLFRLLAPHSLGTAGVRIFHSHVGDGKVANGKPLKVSLSIIYLALVPPKSFHKKI
jgi:hypothetical protein